MAEERRSRLSLVRRCGLALFALVLAYAASGVFARHQVDARLRALQAAVGLTAPFGEPLPQPPPERNAALIYQRAFDATQKSNADAEIGGMTAGGQREFLRGVVSRNAEALSLLHEANGMSDCVFPSIHTEAAAGKHNHLQGIRTASRLLWATALYRGLDHDSDGAVSACLDCVDTAESIASEHGVVALLVRQSCLGMAVNAIERVLCETHLSPQQCRVLADRLARVDMATASVREWCWSGVTDALYETTISWPDRGSQDSPSSRGTPTSHAAGWLGQPWHEWRTERRLAGIEKSLVGAARSWREVKPLADKREREGRHLDEYLVARNRDRCLAHLGLTETALGLYAWKTTHGVWPESPAEVRDQAQWPVPQDPFSGQDFIYGPQGDTFLLYSVGENLTDDGGKFDIADEDGRKGDIVSGRRAETQAAANRAAEHGTTPTRKP